jgi:purine-nucleoside phosphorylase
VSAPTAAPLDDSVFPAVAELARRGAGRPTLLVISASGLGLLPSRLTQAGRAPLEVLATAPALWRESVLHWGELNGLAVWLIEDALDPDGEAKPAWAQAWPVWLAAAAGAVALVHSGGACALGDLRQGTLALARDHLNFTGQSPLRGLGPTRLGPMFPDTTRLHDAHLRRAALGACARLGLEGAEVVVACTPHPALETPAEQRWLRMAGADVSIQGLGAYLLAAAHAGLGTLSIGLVVARAGETTEIARVVASARELAPALDDLLWELAKSARTLAQDSLEDLAR